MLLIIETITLHKSTFRAPTIERMVMLKKSVNNRKNGNVKKECFMWINPKISIFCESE